MRTRLTKQRLPKELSVYDGKKEKKVILEVIKNLESLQKHIWRKIL
jgi:hypothetical protein